MGKVFNLSTSGWKIESQTEVTTGDTLAVRFHCPNIHEQFLIHHAHIVWAMGNDFGVEFLSMQQGQLDRLKKFLTSLSTTNTPEVPESS